MKRSHGLLAAVLVFAAGATTRAASPVETLLTNDTVGFLHIRVAEVWNAPGLAFYRKVLAQVGADELKIFDGRFVPNPSSVEGLTIILPSTRNEPELPNGHPLAKTALWVVTTKEPIDRVDLVRSLGADGRTKTYRNTEYLFDEQNWAGLILLDSRTLVYASEDAIVQMIDQRAGAQGDSALAALYRKESMEKGLAIMGVNPQALARPEILKEVPDKLLPLFKARTVGAKLTLDGGAKLVVTGEFQNKAQAADGEAAVKAVVDMGRQLIAEGLEKLKEKSKPAKQTPSGLQDLPEAFGHLAQKAMLKHLDRLLANLPIHLQDNLVSVEGNLDEVLPDSATVLMVFASAGMVMSKMRFDYASSPGREGEIPYELQTNFRQLYQALEAYHRDNGSYPPAAYRAANGKPLLSWRLLLPYLEGGYYDDPNGGTSSYPPYKPNPSKDDVPPPRKSYADLFKQFKLDEPWDSLNNKKLLAKMPPVFRRPNYYPSSRNGQSMKSGLLGFAGPGALFDGRKGTPKSAIKDGLANTVLLACVENDDSMVFWTKPADIPFQADKPLLNVSKRTDGGLYALLADGSQVFFPKAFVEKSLKSVVTIAGGEMVEMPKRHRDPYSDIKEKPFPPKEDFKKEEPPTKEDLKKEVPKPALGLAKRPPKAVADDLPPLDLRARFDFGKAYRATALPLAEEVIDVLPREAEVLTVLPRLVASSNAAPDPAWLIRGALRDTGTYEEPLPVPLYQLNQRQLELLRGLEQFKAFEPNGPIPVADSEPRNWAWKHMHRIRWPERIPVMPREVK